MTTMRLDVRQAVRALGRTPATTALAVVTLAFGIAAASTTFSAVYAALLRPVPFDDPARLLVLYQTRTTAKDGTARLRWSFPAAVAMRRETGAFEAVGTFSRASVALSGAGDAEQVDGEVVSAGYFEALRVGPVMGEGFRPDDDASGRPVVMLSDGLWRGRFGADPAILGRALHLNGTPVVVVGVMPAGFSGVSGRATLWLPAGMAPRLTYREYLTSPQHFINLVARLRPDVTLAQARAELGSVGPRIPRETAPDAPPAVWSATAQPLGDARIDAVQRRSLLLVLGGGGCVLLVTCVNVAMLLLTRARTRRGEMAIRLALGASRARLARQLLTESAAIAAAGGALGIVFASWGVAWLRGAAPEILASAQNNYGQIAAFSTPAMDAAVLLFTAVVALGTTIVFGAAPAWIAAGSDPAQALAGSSRALAGHGRGRALSALVVCQIGIAVLLLSGALLLVRSVAHMQEGRAAFDGTAVTFWVNAPASRYADADGPAIVERILTRIGRVPGVTSAAVNRCTPYGTSCARSLLFMPGASTRPSDAPVVERHYVSGSYFRALGIALKRGRLLTDEDRAGRPAVTVINETAARRFWPGEDPVGKRLWFSANPGFNDPVKPVEVVGVVADVKYWPIDDAIGPDFYTSYLQFTYPSSLYVVKAADAAVVMPALRRAIAEIDPALPIYDVRMVDQRVADAVARPRFTAIAAAVFAGSAAALAAMGVFGMMAYSVSARREELALRLALGETPRGLRIGVHLHALKLTAIGSLAGAVAAAWVLRSLGSALYGISPTDPAVLTVAAASMAVVALVAAAVPAWRASVTDPMLALRRS
jgi:putative ABC transport system permease protein